jgi:hydrogenase maturation protease
VDEFGIRGMDLAYKLQDGYDIAVFLDAAPRGGEPGELCVIEAEVDEGLVGLDTHGMDPVKVIALARALGAVPDRILVVACEPQTTPDPDEPELQMELSEPVRAALDPAVELVSSLVADLVKTPKSQEGRAA